MSAAYDIVDRTYDVVIVGPGSAALAAAPGVVSAEPYRDFDRRLNVGSPPPCRARPRDAGLAVRQVREWPRLTVKFAPEGRSPA